MPCVMAFLPLKRFPLSTAAIFPQQVSCDRQDNRLVGIVDKLDSY